MSGDNSGDTKKYTEPATSKLEPSTMEELNQWADERELSRSQAVRRLIHEGLEREGVGRSITPGAYVPGLFAAGLIGMAIAVSEPVEPALAIVSGAGVVVAIVVDYFSE
jgi:hypothetical protein